MADTNSFVLGAVAYDPKVVTIWEGFKAYFARHNFAFDFVLYSNYERQVEDHLAGYFHAAWNSPLAWIRSERLARAGGQEVEAIAMRDSDRNLTSVIVVRSDSDIQSVADLQGRRIAVGALDSPQATLLPLHHLRANGLIPEADFNVQYNDLLGGKHGDHIGGERQAARSLMEGGADAACIIDANHLSFVKEGTFPSGATRILAQTAPYDHCNFTVVKGAAGDLVERFRELLLGMSYEDAEVRPLLDLEGLRAWKEGRVEGYRALDTAVNEMKFYDADGRITNPNYRY
jgi:ABC-type phosphate/phosphonate transport system substrate-binding protein